MPSLKKLCTLNGSLERRVIGKTPGGFRIDFPFQGTAAGPHWDGERKVVGVDYATVRADGNMSLDIQGVIGEKREAVAYRGFGVSIVNEDQSATPQELITFQTGNEDLAWLNNQIAVAIGHGNTEGELVVEFYLVTTDDLT